MNTVAEGGFKWSHPRWRALRGWLTERRSHKQGERPLLKEKNVKIEFGRRVNVGENPQFIVDPSMQSDEGHLYLTTHHIIFLGHNRIKSSSSIEMSVENLLSVEQCPDNINALLAEASFIMRLTFLSRNHCQTWLSILSAFKTSSNDPKILSFLRRRMISWTKKMKSPSRVLQQWRLFNNTLDMQTKQICQSASIGITYIEDSEITADDFEPLEYNSRGVQAGILSIYPHICDFLVATFGKMMEVRNFIDEYFHEEREMIIFSLIIILISFTLMISKYLPLSMIFVLSVISFLYGKENSTEPSEEDVYSTIVFINDTSDLIQKRIRWKNPKKSMKLLFVAILAAASSTLYDEVITAALLIAYCTLYTFRLNVSDISQTLLSKVTQIVDGGLFSKD